MTLKIRYSRAELKNLKRYLLRSNLLVILSLTSFLPSLLNNREEIPPMALVIPDKTWAIMTIRQEADGESINGKIAVAEVIRNRMRRHYFSDGTIAGTVLKAYQFSGWNTDDPNRLRIAKMDDSDPLTEQAFKAYNEAFEKESNLVSGSVLYHSILMKPFPYWTMHERITKTTIIGRHIFYRDGD